jgi:HSP20 family molecular chaperone IbpA
LACSSPGSTVRASAISPSARIVGREPNPGGTVNKPAVQRQSRPLLPELSELSTGWPTFAGFRPFSHVLRMEDETRDGYYLVRTEVPGVDPIEDLEVTVRDGQLSIKASRREPKDVDGGSEFVYRTFERTVALPVGADEDDIHATYDRGILTVSVPLTDDEPATRHIEVIETILVDDDDEVLHVQAELTAPEQQEQPVG